MQVPLGATRGQRLGAAQPRGIYAPRLSPLLPARPAARRDLQQRQSALARGHARPCRRHSAVGGDSSSGSSSSSNSSQEPGGSKQQQQAAGDAVGNDTLSAAATIDAIQRLTGRTGGAAGASPSPAAATTPADAAAAPEPPKGPLAAAAAARAQAAFAAALAAFAAAWAALSALLNYFPSWVNAQRLRQLRESADESPGDADRQAALLAGLNEQKQPRAVLERVESKRFASNSAVVVEYIKALVATERIHEYASTDAEAAAAAAAVASGAAAGPGPGVGVADAAAAAAALSGAALAPGQDHRSLRQLLRELEAAALGGGNTSGSGGSGASSINAASTAAALDDTAPGASLRRPLHVVVQGGFAGGPSGAPLAARGRPGPLGVLLRITTTAAVILGLSFAWLVGAQAARRAAAAAGAGSGLGPGLPASTASSAAGGLAGGGTPALDPKEYRKEELPEKSVKCFKDVLGCDESKAELQEVVEFLKNPEKFTRLGAKLPKGVLLTGPPGTGKTLLARAVAGEAGVPFFYRAGSEFEELYVGVGSRRMRALFAAAKKKAPCIVFIDEIDAIGGNRKHWENHTRKTLNQLLVEMDGFEANEGVIVMAATNLPETLDPALKRPGRFDRQVAVPLPDVKGRTEILQYYMADKPFAADVDADLLARQTSGFSGADLSNLINEAALLAAQRDAPAVTAPMLDYAYDKILMGVERKTAVRSPEALKRTAYHESGHALVALHTPGASPIHKATIVPRGHALGMVTQVGREDEFSINRQQMMARILVCMGGQVAEELIFGRDQVSSGATDDLRQATEWARHMVAECGMSEAVGPVYIKDSSSGPQSGGMLSEATKQQVDAEVRAMLVKARADVTRLLSDRIGELHTLSRALVEHETLTASDIKKVLAGERLAPPTARAGGGGGSGGGAKAPGAAGAPAPVAAAVEAAAMEEQ